MLIGSGTPNTTAVDLASNILKTVGGNLKKLASLQHTDLAIHKGMGLARSSAILAALELGRRAFAFSPIHIYPKGKKPFGKIIR